MNFYYKMVPGDTYCVTGYKGDENHIEFLRILPLQLLMIVSLRDIPRLTPLPSLKQ